MNEKELSWQVQSTKRLLKTPIFDVLEQHSVAPNGLEGDYIAMAARDWVMVIAEYRGSFLLVRQWRHAAQCLSLEFPGGVTDRGEEPRESAYRELQEETGFKAGKLTHLGTVNPNPALFQNHLHVYLAQDLEETGEQHLDDDELLTYELRPVDEVLASFGTDEYIHGLMGTAIALYLRRQMSGIKDKDGTERLD